MHAGREGSSLVPGGVPCMQAGKVVYIVSYLGGAMHAGREGSSLVPGGCHACRQGREYI